MSRDERRDHVNPMAGRVTVQGLASPRPLKHDAGVIVEIYDVLRRELRDVEAMLAVEGITPAEALGRVPLDDF